MEIFKPIVLDASPLPLPASLLSPLMVAIAEANAMEAMAESEFERCVLQLEWRKLDKKMKEA